MARAAGLLVLALGGCGDGDDGDAAVELSWRCTQSPALTLVGAACTCTGYRPGDEATVVGVEVEMCAAALPCCFVGPVTERAGATGGVEECRCVQAAACAAEMAARPGTERVALCPPPVE